MKSPDSSRYITMSHLSNLAYEESKMESMVESIQRFESFLTEMDAALQMGLSFKEWASLSPESEIPSDVTGLILLMPA